MTRTEWIIRVLNDSLKTEISLENKLWLLENVEKLHIGVLPADCTVSTFEIAESWSENGSILIQDGIPIQFKADFNPLKEALLITKYPNQPYVVSLYSPNQFEDK